MKINSVKAEKYHSWATSLLLIQVQRPIQVDASNQGLGAVLSQRSAKDNQMHPCAYLSLTPSMITETDSVTLKCQAPSSVSVHQCYFMTVKPETSKAFSCLRTLTGTELLLKTHQSSPAEVEVKCYYTVMYGDVISPSSHSDTSSITVLREPAKSFSCLKTLTGTELLKISHQSSPAEVKVTCFYLNMYPSPESDVSSIIIRTSLPPKLIVNPPVINETDSVTLNCQTPSSVSVSQCYFHIVRGEAARHFSCLKTLTGTELLKMSHKSSPAEVEVMCFYTVKFGETDSPSPHSDTSSITIHSETPQMSLQHFPGEYVLFTCSLPGPANHDTRCNLYFGEASDPVLTKNIWKERSSTKQWFCQFIVTVDYLLSRLRLVQQSDASCDYTLGSSLSPRSDGYNLTGKLEQTRIHFHITCTETDLLKYCGKEVTQDSDYNDIYYDHRYCGKGVTQDSDYNDIYYDHRTDCQLASCVHSCNSCKTNIRLDCWYTKLHWWFYLYCPNISETTISVYFHIVRGEAARRFSCLKTLTGTELLKMSHKSSPAEVEVMCFYTVKFGETDSPSPHSDTSSITYTQYCGKGVTQDSDYNDIYYDHRPDCQSASCIHSCNSCKTNIRWTRKFVAVVTGCGLTAGAILLVSVMCWNKKGTGQLAALKVPSLVGGGYDETYSIVTYEYNFGEPARSFSCLQTLTGIELLNISHQSPPAEVQLTCFYLKESPSPESDVSSIIIQTTQPKLTVNPSVINETDSITLNCQTPSSVSVSQCFFYTLSGGNILVFSCVKTLTGTELLKMANQSSPAVVKVKCFYTLKLREFNPPSPHSDTSSITIHTSPLPKLTVNPSVITETDSVTLNCQAPSSVSVNQCFFYTLSGGNISNSSCLKTLTGTELLKMSDQSSPAEVKLKCFYIVKTGELSQSPESDASSITIHCQRPQMSLQHFPGEHVLFTCSLPGPANHDTRCNLYFGEASDPVLTKNIWRERSSTKQWFCQFIVTVDDLLSRLRLVQQSDASCEYTLGSEPNSLSPRSDGCSLTGKFERSSFTW
ncbi:hypothetical protein L3Q82_024861 [Scortum barcoo]|uniref:Uncharacterized protein n=1 Tax=Scortum barcoo TaxID=214431 RepID=A0ACB8WRK4_9TELE|nr:hypothetical protein L3Q82_024861 [Scortum barcoo]